MAVAVGLGIAEYPFESTAGFWRWIAMAEEGGVDSMWQTDRVVSAEPILECMSVMAALAGATKRLKFGMNVASVGMRDPVLLAKQCATIDVLSGGRLLPAFGIGNIRQPEWQAAGRQLEGRGRRTDEGLEIIRRLWGGGKVGFAGEFYHLEGASIAPKPVQPDLPMWIGGSSKAAIRRTATYGTGWQAGLETPEEVGPVVAEIRAAAAAAGRAIDDDHYGAGFPFRFATGDEDWLERAKAAYAKRTGREPDGYFIVGDRDTILGRIAAYVDAGISKFVLRPLARGDQDMLAQTRRLIDEVLPEVARRWPKPAKG